jgi:anhydro-N-acetylmuramic acid kinase
MIYRVLGLMSGSSLDGLDLAFAEFHRVGEQWHCELKAADCLPYNEDWRKRLAGAVHLSALDYQLLHADYGHLLGSLVNQFIADRGLEYQVQFISSHGHTSFHLPAQKMTGQLGDGAALAATTGLPVVSDLRAMDVALGGQGAPIVPIGEKLLWGQYDYFLNLGGIANLSVNHPEKYRAFDVCAANRVLNLLAEQRGMSYDAGGALAAAGTLHVPLLRELDALEYYSRKFPKSLANDFGTDTVLPLVLSKALPVEDALHTYCVHIAGQIGNALQEASFGLQAGQKMLVTGGGAHNDYLTGLIRKELEVLGVELVVPDKGLVDYKEALVMAFMGVLRWREEANVLHTVTGASNSSIGGAIWMGSL